MPHIGYSVDGKKVFRPARGDELDKFLSTVDDPAAWSVLSVSAAAAAMLTTRQDRCIRQERTEGYPVVS
jgi:ribosome biogenesis protein ERB1